MKEGGLSGNPFGCGEKVASTVSKGTGAKG